MMLCQLCCNLMMTDNFSRTSQIIVFCNHVHILYNSSINQAKKLEMG